MLEDNRLIPKNHRRREPWLSRGTHETLVTGVERVPLGVVSTRMHEDNRLIRENHRWWEPRVRGGAHEKLVGAVKRGPVWIVRGFVFTLVHEKMRDSSSVV